MCLAMDQVPGLVATFLEHMKARFVPLTESEAAALWELLIRAWKEARAQWPGVELPAEPFVRYIAERLDEKEGPDRPIPERLASLSLTELYLACACLQGLAPAHEAFERHYLAALPEKLRTLKLPAAVIDDVRQLTGVKLLVATPESAPKIGDYVGRGALLSWVVVIAARIANRLRESDKRAPEDDADWLPKVRAEGRSPEDRVIMARHQAEFRKAVREAFTTLSAEDRHLLRLHFADGLSTHELAKLYKVNQSTVSRWLKSSRQQVYEETQRLLQERLGLSTQGFESFIVQVNSQLDMSLSQILDNKNSRLEPGDG
jgi:RNA polymerase sigma-70 factor